MPFPTLKGPFRFKRPYRRMELATPPSPNVRFCPLHSLQSLVGGIDIYQDSDGRDRVAVPYDEINEVPETTFRQLHSFRWWGVPSYGHSDRPLSPESRKRHACGLLSETSKIPRQFIGDGDDIVDINQDFIEGRVHDIELYHLVDSDAREVERPTINRYLEHTNNGGYFMGIPILVSLMLQ